MKIQIKEYLGTTEAGVSCYLMDDDKTVFLRVGNEPPNAMDISLALKEIQEPLDRRGIKTINVLLKRPDPEALDSQ